MENSTDVDLVCALRSGASAVAEWRANHPKDVEAWRWRKEKQARERATSHWIYERPLNPGYVSIYFDENDRVRSINDEQVDPVTYGSGSWTKDTLLPKSE